MAAPASTEQPRSSFGEFGAAIIAEVCTPRFLRHRLEQAIDAVFSGHNMRVADFPVQLTAVHVWTPRLINDDGFERCFTVVVRTDVVAEIGPRVIATTMDATIVAELTVRLRTFHPAIARLEIDPLTRDDVRVRARPRGGLLAPLSLLDGGPQFSWITGRVLSWLLTVINQAIANSADQRQIDVLELLRPADQPSDAAWHAGTLAPGEHTEWPVQLGELTQLRLRPWAGQPGQTERDDTAGHDDKAGLELSVWDADGALIDQLTLAAMSTTPQLGPSPTWIEVGTASDTPTNYRVRLTNPALIPLTYRVEAISTTAPGRRTRFAEFGEVLAHRGIDQETVARLVTDQLAQHGPVSFEHSLARGTATARLTQVTELHSRAHERAFRLLGELDITMTLTVSRRPLTVTVRAGITLRVSTTTGPAQILVRFAPVSQRDLQVVRGWRGRERHLLTPPRLRRRAAAELNQRLNHVARDIAVTTLLETTPGQLNPRSRHTSVSAAATAREPSSNQVKRDHMPWDQAS